MRLVDTLQHAGEPSAGPASRTPRARDDAATFCSPPSTASTVSQRSASQLSVTPGTSERLDTAAPLITAAELYAEVRAARVWYGEE